MTDCAVAVIGAGVIGQAITYELVRRRVSVTVVDARGAGLGSTQAAAGMLVPYIEGTGNSLLPLAVRSLEMYDAFVDRLSRDSGLRVGYGRPGSLQVVDRTESLDELLALAGSLRAMGVKCDLVDAADVRKIEPTLTTDVGGALQIDTHGFVVASIFPAPFLLRPSGTAPACAFPRVRIGSPAKVIRWWWSSTTIDSPPVTLSLRREAGRGRSKSMACRRCRCDPCAASFCNWRAMDPR